MAASGVAAISGKTSEIIACESKSGCELILISGVVVAIATYKVGKVSFFGPGELSKGHWMA